MDVSWSILKTHITSKSLKPQYLDLGDIYYLAAFDGPFELNAVIQKGSEDATDFENNFLTSFNKTIEPKSSESGALLSSIIEPEGAFETYISHDWCDKTTWYQESVRVEGGSASTNVGLVYSMPHDYLIDLEHGKVTNEDKFSSGYIVKAYDDGVEVSIDSIDYDAGEITLSASPSGVVTFDYSYATNSTWTLSYEDGLLLRINKAEVQFTQNVIFRPMEFSVWITHPVYGDMKVDSVKYKSMKDIINISNLGFSVPAFSGLSNNVIIFPFDYQRPIDLRPDLQMKIKLEIIDHIPMVGEFASASIYVAEVEID